ncbi:TetR/AcrR family transcriptional regulator [Marinibaculum pumilum]|uniref:TetR/AcrR family transcriptional regulator n=1 Tax=Marinibaculum pumilum TaxID=1766165 RepID=A0ABV7L7D8_9PROT
MAAKAWREADDREEMHARKRRLILEAAARAFAESGYHQTSIDQIAARLQVTKPTIYYYVRNKDEILFQIAQTALDDLDERIAAAQQGNETALQKLKLYFRIYARIINDDFGYCMAFVSDNVLKPPARAKLRRYKKEFELRVRHIIEAGRQDGTVQVSDPRLFTFALFGAFNWMPQWYSDAGEVELDRIVDHFLAIFCAGGIAPGRAPDQVRAR